MRKVNLFILLYFISYISISIGWGIYLNNTSTCNSLGLFCGVAPMIINRLLVVGVFMIPFGIILYLIGYYIVSNKK